MLVLRRKKGESIIIDGNIKISVLVIEGERVKIGIDAPSNITIVREELLNTQETSLSANFLQPSNTKVQII